MTRTSEAVTQQAIVLASPAEEPALSFHKAVSNRRTIREIAADPQTLVQLSNLYSAACGENRKAGPFGQSGRTAASVSNSQEIDLYVLLESGVYLYNAEAHRLDIVTAGDQRPSVMNSRQGICTKAPVQLIHVIDLDRLSHTDGFEEPGLQNPEKQKFYYLADTGIVAGNVYFYAAADGLAAWFHNCDKEALRKILSIRPKQKVLFAQSVGWPAH